MANKKTLSQEEQNLFFTAEQIIYAHNLFENQKDDYNIFYSLKQENKELVHTGFISSLLTLKKSHPLRNVFFKLFLEHVLIKLKDLVELKNTDNVEDFFCEHQYHTLEDGILDFYISSKNLNYGCCIEMKVRAIDSDGQLEKYNKFLENENFKKFEIYYLTPDGGNAQNYKGNYTNLNFAEHLLPWLRACLEKSYDFPIIRENIKQYINVLKEICSIDSDNNKSNELKKFLKSKNNFEIFSELKNKYNSIKEKLSENEGMIYNELSENFDELTHQLESKFWEEVREAIIFKIPNIDAFIKEEDTVKNYDFSNAFRIYFYKKLNCKEFPEQYLCFGFDRFFKSSKSEDRKISFFIGFKKLTDIDFDSSNKELYSSFKEKFTKIGIKNYRTRLERNFIDLEGITFDDLPSLMLQDNEGQKENRINLLVDFFIEKYKLIESIC